MNVEIKIYPSVSNRTYDLFDSDLDIKKNKILYDLDKWTMRYNSFFDFQYNGDGLILSFDYGEIKFKSGYLTQNFIDNYFDGLSFASPGTSNPPFCDDDARHAQLIGQFISSKFQCYVEAMAYRNYYSRDKFAFYCGGACNFGSIPQDCEDANFQVCREYWRKKRNRLSSLWDILSIVEVLDG